MSLSDEQEPESVAFIRRWLAEGNQDEHYAGLLAAYDELRDEVERLRAKVADAWDDGYVARLGDTPRYAKRSEWGNPHRAALASGDEVRDA